MHTGFTASHSWSKGTHCSGKFVHILFVLFFPDAEHFEVGRHFATTFSHSFISRGMRVLWFLLWITNSWHAFGKANANSAHCKFNGCPVSLCVGQEVKCRISCSVAMQWSKQGALSLPLMTCHAYTLMRFDFRWLHWASTKDAFFTSGIHH